MHSVNGPSLSQQHKEIICIFSHTCSMIGESTETNCNTENQAMRIYDHCIVPENTACPLSRTVEDGNIGGG